MKCTIIEVSHQLGTFKGKLEGSEEPKAGSVYVLEEFKQHSSKQRRLFEPIVMLYFNSLCFPSDWICETWEDLRDLVKLKLGQGVNLYEYSDDNHNIQRVMTLEEIPIHILEDRINNPDRVKIYDLISTTKYSQHDFWKMTDNLIRQMIHGGVSKSKMAKKFNKILDTIGFTE
jgi:hypothetical protein